GHNNVSLAREQSVSYCLTECDNRGLRVYLDFGRNDLDIKLYVILCEWLVCADYVRRSPLRPESGTPKFCDLNRIAEVILEELSKRFIKIRLLDSDSRRRCLLSLSCNDCVASSLSWCEQTTAGLRDLRWVPDIQVKNRPVDRVLRCF